MKKFVIGLCSVAAAGALFTGAMLSSATVAEKNSLGSDKALEIALTDAGIKKENAIKISSEFDKENGRYIFDVDFSFNGKEYDYTIDAKNGEILKRDVENDNGSKKQTSSKTESSTNSQKKRITLTAAKNAALKDANVSSSNAKFTKAKLEKDDGRYEYDIEFTSGNKKYEYTIDAYTAKVLDKEVETIKTTSKPTTNTASQAKRITLTAAKNAALKDANVSSSNAKFTKAKLEKDDGKYEYDIEFTSGNKKYEYTIDAYTTKVLDKEVDTIKTTSKPTTNTASQAKRITLTAAKNAALKDANVSSSNAKFIKAKLEKDDGIYEYDIEFTSGNKKYEYTIDAYTAKVLDKEVETIKTTSKPTASTASQAKRITLTAAKNAALKDANVSSSNAKFTKAKLEKDDGNYEYDIEFTSGNKKYEYTIDAYTAKVLDKEVETIKTTSKPTTITSSQAKRITLTAAKNAALKDANVSSSNAKFTKAKLEKDNGIYEYDIEFTSGSKKYEYTIDAYTGKVLDKEISSYSIPQASSSQTSTLISIDKARAIALEHAGLKESEVVIEKVKLEKENGRYEYEVEFSKGNWEYEYSINAKTGAIIESDKEYDD